MSIKKRIVENEKIQKIKDHYQYGNITFLEAIKAVMNMADSGEIQNDNATIAIRQMSRIKLPFQRGQQE